MIEKYIHFIGIGGAGMVGLALIMHEKGHCVSGSDLTKSTNTKLLLSKGINITIGHSPKNIPKQSDLLIVRSSAISDDNIEYQKCEESQYRYIKRGEMLAEVAKDYKFSIAIAGTHGKTSVTALLVHILKSLGKKPGYMIGGKVTGWSSSASAGDGTLFITESDESDGTQVHLKSNLLLITNIEDDHSWSVGGTEKLFSNFATIAKNAKKIIYNKSEKIEEIIALSKNNDKFPPVGLKLNFDEKILADKKDWGFFQKENANIAVECAVAIGEDRDKAMCEVRKFPGVERRMSTRFASYKLQIIEDYAHHPTEVKAAIDTLRERFPDYHLKIIFQPHRYARLEKYINEFASELKKGDEIFIVPVFAAWSENGTVNSADLANLIGKKATNINDSWDNIAKKVVKKIDKPEIIAIFGAGDIEKIITPLINMIH